ncbi:phosphoribosyltransferase [Niabella ginsenosidivorans]|uniref:Phosphoribosyltransferase n=1 Tax=Niabella ginsenosidivorans TaxID=1176587 RepID=A0A1A9I9M8_9BACT|nr:ComF family protein [Niabella ginsenosidivorans]ANH83430.1 phosphoribosyltransferase [Niabella ginsenosidivorans]
MSAANAIKNALIHLFYPHICAGCASDALPLNSQLCLQCLHELPATGFEGHANNPVEKIFAGRIRFEAATARYYFSKGSPLQHMMHQLKYGGNKALGHQLGIEFGNALKASGRFRAIDAIVPMPLYSARERKRGYNQAAVLAKGIAEVLNKPVWETIVCRAEPTETQTKKNRTERWKNMQGKFFIIDNQKAIDQHLLLVDDVVTTGATFEACGSVILEITGARLSIAALCYAND